MNDTLARIVASKRRWLETAMRGQSLEQLERELVVGRVPAPRDFVGAIERALASRGVAVIAECKARSPSAGRIRESYDAPQIAKAYAEAGAACISVLTEEEHFGGSPSHMRDVADACPLPVLCKDFILDEWQIAHARLHRADCVLLIAAALDDERLHALAEHAHQLGLATLLEVHTEEEIARTQNCPASLIGINNRNLADLSVDIETGIRLRTLLPADRLVISESGISSTATMARLREAGLPAFLIGEHLLRQPDPGPALAELLQCLSSAKPNHDAP